MNTLRNIIIGIGALATGGVATGVGLGMNSSGSDPWQTVLAVVGVLTAGGLGVTASHKLNEFRLLISHISEALVAMGLAGMSITKAFEDGKLTNEEKKDIVEKSKVIMKEYEDVYNSAVELISKK